ncbi:MAG: ATP-dependent helicase [Lachnospiraceae bacterium]|nr:ATP-dependent helicase [Lachnospiraceae bacterium]
MKSDILKGADPQQQKAVCTQEGPVMVLAGPGAGKTFVITRRLKYLIEECGVAPEEILVITFTKAAAEEMECRFDMLCKEVSGVTFGTFHAVYFHILKKFYNLDRTGILGEGEKRKLLKEVINGVCGSDTDDETLMAVLEAISRIKNAGLSADSYSSDIAALDPVMFKKVYAAYNSLLRERKKLDFDDMILRCRELFLERPDILDMWRERYRYILIDEFQDINPMQYEVIKMLAYPHNNLCVVGDDDQSIYAFRGSDPDIMLGFKKDYPEARVIKLENNYRSGKSIIDTSLKLIGCNKKRFRKKIRAGSEKNCTVALLDCRDRNDEAEKICGLITAAAKHGITYREMAVLLRTNAMAGFFAGKLRAAGIPFYVKDRVESIFDSCEGKDIRAMLDFSKGKTGRENFLRFMNKPVRYISRADIGRGDIELSRMLAGTEPKKYMYGQLKQLIYDMDKLKKMHPFAAVNYIRKGMGYEQAAVKEAAGRGRGEEAVIEILNMIQEAAGECDSYEDWLERIKSEQEGMEEMKKDSPEAAVQLMTMHSSKGLEFGMVIIPELNEGQIPSNKCTKNNEIEEERRLLYVAMTRAKEKLFLLYREKNLQKKILPSRFIKELR